MVDELSLFFCFVFVGCVSSSPLTHADCMLMEWGIKQAKGRVTGVARPN